MGLLFHVSIVAAVLAWFYGRSIHHAWLPAVITFVCVFAGGWLYAGGGQICGVVVSALIIFVAFTLPEQRRAAKEAAEKEKAVSELPNEEDI